MEQSVRASESQRIPEEFDEFKTKVGGVLTIIICVITWCLFVAWLVSGEGGGGLATRGLAGYFNWHPFLMSTAFILLMVPSALAFEVYLFPRNINKILHGSINTIAFVCMLVALGVTLDVHNNITSHSAHAMCGYLTISVVTVTYLIGVIFYLFPCLPAQSRSVKPLHKRFGTLCLLCGLATILLGIPGLFTRRQMELGQVMAALIFVIMFGIVFSLTKFVDKPMHLHLQ